MRFAPVSLEPLARAESLVRLKSKITIIAFGMLHFCLAVFGYRWLLGSAYGYGMGAEGSVLRYIVDAFFLVLHFPVVLALLKLVPGVFDNSGTFYVPFVLNTAFWVSLLLLVRALSTRRRAA